MNSAPKSMGGPFPPGHPRNLVNNRGQQLVTAAGVPITVGGEPMTITPDLPGVLLSSVITLLGKVPEGQLIEVVGPAWDAIADILAGDPEERFRIPDRKWEELIAGSYDRAGYVVTLTPRSGDGGRDVIATKDDYVSIRIIDQVKAYGDGKRVTADDVRALLGVLGADHKASKGLVTTTAEFAPGIATDQAIQQYVPTRLELVDGPRLIERFARLRGK
jgi:restriction system protein